MLRSLKRLSTQTKRGDTIIEVMLGFAIFAFIAIISVVMMNKSLAAGERSLEIVVARNELNAQAEALRFIHSAYVAELSLPECEFGNTNVSNCQQYRVLWEAIKERAMDPDEAALVPFVQNYPLTNCSEPYGGELSNAKAFILNPRQVNVANHNGALIKYDGAVFKAPQLGARIVYGSNTGGGTSDDRLGGTAMQDYNAVKSVEGIWVIAVKGGSGSEPLYYDFYIETCWYGADAATPSTLDTIIRLYNPDAS